MCIIVAKNAGIEMPSDSTLRTCFNNNPDGAGFMIATGKAVMIRKGFMTYQDFAEALGEMGDLTDRSVVMHFRIATHGGIRPGCCHPFPVTSDMSTLRSTEETDCLCMAHNGVIQGMITGDGISDTMAFIRDVVAPLRRAVPSMIYNDDVLSVLNLVAGSKLALLDSSGELVTLGEFQEHDGVMYSNGTYTSHSTWTRSYANVFAELPAPEMPSRMCLECDEYEACAEFAPYCKDEWDCAATLASDWGYMSISDFLMDFPEAISDSLYDDYMERCAEEIEEAYAQEIE